MRKIGNYEIPDYNPYNEFTDLQFFVFLDKYANYLPTEGRRETWEEAVTRSVDVLKFLSQDRLDKHTYQFLFESIYRMDVLPSMRLFSMPMAAVERDNSVIYNCSNIGIDSIRSIVDCLYLSMSGCGVGISVEKQYISKLPKVINKEYYTFSPFVIEDSQIGWAESLRYLLESLINIGVDPVFDYSQIRPAGSYLKTKGGYASGPQPLIDLHEHVRKIVKARQGQNLRSIDILDIVTKIGDCAVSGGSRRSAISVIFDYDDNDMLLAKNGNYYEHSPWRSNSNNSAVWYDDMPMQHKRDLIEELFANGNGEPGIWNKSAQFRTLPERRKYNINNESELNSNPCFEIVLKSHEFCNLSTAVLRPTDSITTMVNKVIAASIIGTIQSMADNFPYIDPRFQNNLHEERLLGVCLTGIADVHHLLGERVLHRLKDVAVSFNQTTALQLGIEPSLAVTAIKPSGNTSALTKSGPGINPEHTEYSYRNVVVNRNTSMFNFLYANEVPFIDHPTRSTDAVFKFPKSNVGSLTLKDTNAIKQLEIWKQFKQNYTEHNPSVSITYRQNEIDDIKDWIYEHDKIIGGTAFFPSYDANHPYLPIQEITKSEYEQAMGTFPTLNWSNFKFYETGFDERNAVAECAGGQCEIMK
jgi:ribonucleoside-triphosphate reductase